MPRLTTLVTALALTALAAAAAPTATPASAATKPNCQRAHSTTVAGNRQVRVLDAAGERAVDSGAIHPESLALTPGGRLSWDNAGTARSALLTHLTT